MADILSRPSPKGKLNPIFIFQRLPCTLNLFLWKLDEESKKINNLNMKVIKLSWITDYREFLTAVPWSSWNKRLPKPFIYGILTKIWLQYSWTCNKVIWVSTASKTQVCSPKKSSQGYYPTGKIMKILQPKTLYLQKLWLLKMLHEQLETDCVATGMVNNAAGMPNSWALLAREGEMQLHFLGGHLDFQIWLLHFSIS